MPPRYLLSTPLLSFLCPDQFLFVGAREGVLVFDVTDMAHPKRVAENRTYGSVGRLALAGDYLVAAVPGGIAIYDVADPLDPQFVSFVRGNAGNGLAAKGDYFYAANYAWGGAYGFYEFSDPTQPKRVGSADAYHGTGIAVEGRYVYGSALSYIAVFDAPVSGEEPKGPVALECQKIPSRGRLERCLELSGDSPGLFVDLGKEAPELFDSLEALPDDTIERCARAVASIRRGRAHKKLTGEASSALSTLEEFFSRVACHTARVSLRAQVAGALVPGYVTPVRLVLQNAKPDEARGNLSLRQSSDAGDVGEADNPKIEIRGQETEAGKKAVERVFDLSCPKEVKPGTRLRFSVSGWPLIDGQRFRLREDVAFGSTPPLSFGRIPYAIQIDNLHWTRLELVVHSNAPATLQPQIRWKTPAGWHVRIDGKTGTSRVLPQVERQGETHVGFTVRVSDGEAPLGQQKTTLELGDQITKTQRTLCVDARRLQRWHFSRRFPLEIEPGTTRIRSYPPEQKVNLNEKQNGRPCWRQSIQGARKAYVDCSAALGTSAGFVAYAYARVLSPLDGPVDVRLKGNRAEVRGWLNGRPTDPLRAGKAGPAEAVTPGADRGLDDGEPDAVEAAMVEEMESPVLKRGWNDLLVKLSRAPALMEKGKSWGFAMELRSQDGKMIPGLRLDSLGADE